MAYQPLHHKYRPQTFAQLVGQDAIATTLSQAIATNKIAPAYLFAGPRGTGKTSSARIFAKSLNCLAREGPTPDPCGTCESCRAIAAGTSLDTIEIDAASNTGVDNMRELIERAQFAPVQARYKLYLIDEAHMLSTAAFNALLKTLEEPPPRVTFVLATTDPQRVLPTILSRCQRFDFRRIPLESLTAHLEKIARAEAIAIAPEAIASIAQLANGGLRDAESLLDQLGLLPGEIDVERVWELVGAVPEGDFLSLVRGIRTGDVAATLSEIRQFLDRGREPPTLLQGLASIFRDLLLARAAPERSDLTSLPPPVWRQLCQEAAAWEPARILAIQKTLKESEVQLRNTVQPRLWLEVTLLSLGTTAPAAAATVAPAVVPAVVPVAEEIPPPAGDPEPAIAAPPAALPVPAAVPPAEPPAPEETPNLQPLWRRALETLQPPATKALVAQHCRLLALDGTVATIGVRNANLLRLATSKQANLETAFSEVCQQPTRVQLEVAAAEFDAPPPIARSPADPPPLPEPAEIPAPPPVLETPAAPAANSDTSAATGVPADLQAATQTLAGEFDGEPIDLGDRAIWQEVSPVAASENSQGADTPRGGPASEGGDDPDDEVPFARQPPRGDLWDRWEVAANRPGRFPL